MKLVMMKIGLRRVSLAFENSTEARIKADHLSEKLKDNFCFVRLILFTHPDSFNRQLGTGNILLAGLTFKLTQEYLYKV